MLVKRSISSMLCVYALSTGLFALAAYYQDFYFSVVTKNPGGFKLLISLALALAGAVCALYALVGKKAKHPGAFTSTGTLLFTGLVLIIGLVTPYHFSLLLRRANLIIQTIDLIAAYASAAFVLLASISAATAFCSLQARYRAHVTMGGVPQIGLRLGWACTAIAAGATCAAMQAITGKWGHEVLFLAIGIAGILCAAVSAVLDAIVKKHTS